MLAVHNLSYLQQRLDDLDEEQQHHEKYKSEIKSLIGLGGDSSAEAAPAPAPPASKVPSYPLFSLYLMLIHDMR